MPLFFTDDQISEICIELWKRGCIRLPGLGGVGGPGAGAGGGGRGRRGPPGPPGPAGPAGEGAVLAFGNDNVGSNTAVRYLSPWYSETLAEMSATANARIIAPRPGTLSLAANATGPASNLVNAVAVVAGDEIDVQVTKAGNASPSPDNVTVTMEYA